MQSGDLLACYGGGWASRTIRLWMGFLSLLKLRPRDCPSHIAFLANDPDGRLVVFESTSLSKIPDCIDETMREGVQAHKIKDFLAYYPGAVWRYPLLGGIPDKNSSHAFIHELHKRRVDYDGWQAIGSALPWKNKESGQKFFCSELYVAFLEEGGRISDVNSSEIHPCDLTGWNIFSSPLRLK